MPPGLLRPELLEGVVWAGLSREQMQAKSWGGYSWLSKQARVERFLSREGLEPALSQGAREHKALGSF